MADACTFDQLLSDLKKPLKAGKYYYIRGGKDYNILPQNLSNSSDEIKRLRPSKNPSERRIYVVLDNTPVPLENIKVHENCLNTRHGRLKRVFGLRISDIDGFKGEFEPNTLYYICRNKTQEGKYVLRWYGNDEAEEGEIIQTMFYQQQCGHFKEMKIFCELPMDHIDSFSLNYTNGTDSTRIYYCIYQRDGGKYVVQKINRLPLDLIGKIVKTFYISKKGVHEVRSFRHCYKVLKRFCNSKFKRPIWPLRPFKQWRSTRMIEENMFIRVYRIFNIALSYHEAQLMLSSKIRDQSIFTKNYANLVFRQRRSIKNQMTEFFQFVNNNWQVYKVKKDVLKSDPRFRTLEDICQYIKEKPSIKNIDNLLTNFICYEVVRVQRKDNKKPKGCCDTKMISSNPADPENSDQEASETMFNHGLACFFFEQQTFEVLLMTQYVKSQISKLDKLYEILSLKMPLLLNEKVNEESLTQCEHELVIKKFPIHYPLGFKGKTKHKLPIQDEAILSLAKQSKVTLKTALFDLADTLLTKTSEEDILLEMYSRLSKHNLELVNLNLELESFRRKTFKINKKLKNLHLRLHSTDKRILEILSRFKNGKGEESVEFEKLKEAFDSEIYRRLLYHINNFLYLYSSWHKKNNIKVDPFLSRKKPRDWPEADSDKMYLLNQWHAPIKYLDTTKNENDDNNYRPLDMSSMTKTESKEDSSVYESDYSNDKTENDMEICDSNKKWKPAIADKPISNI